MSDLCPTNSNNMNMDNLAKLQFLEEKGIKECVWAWLPEGSNSITVPINDSIIAHYEATNRKIYISGLIYLNELLLKGVGEII